MISGLAEGRARAAVVKLEEQAEAAEDAAPGLLGSWWADVIDAESAATAAKAGAATLRASATRHRAWFVRLVSDPKATDAQAAELERSARVDAGLGDLVKETGRLVSVGGAVADTARETAKDLGLPSDPRDVLRWVKRGAWVVGIAAVVLAIRDLRRMVRE